MWEHMLCSFPQDGILEPALALCFKGNPPCLHLQCSSALEVQVADSCALAGFLMQRHLDDALTLFICVSTVEEPD